jgi:hypothetical protein
MERGREGGRKNIANLTPTLFNDVTDKNNLIAASPELEVSLQLTMQVDYIRMLN